VNKHRQCSPHFIRVESSYRLCLVQRSHGVRRGCADRFLKSLVQAGRRGNEAEKTHPQDLLSGDVLLLASSTGIQGAPRTIESHMWVLLHDKAKTLDLGGKPCA